MLTSFQDILLLFGYCLDIGSDDFPLQILQLLSLHRIFEKPFLLCYEIPWKSRFISDLESRTTLIPIDSLKYIPPLYVIGNKRSESSQLHIP